MLNDIKRIFGPKATIPRSRTTRAKLKSGVKTGVSVEVKKKPHLTKEQISQKRRDEATLTAEARRLANERLRREESVLRTLRDPLQPIGSRITAAAMAGYKVIHRGPEDLPRRVIFIKGDERICFDYPKGKNARRAFESKEPAHAIA